MGRGAAWAVNSARDGQNQAQVKNTLLALEQRALELGQHGPRGLNVLVLGHWGQEVPRIRQTAMGEGRGSASERVERASRGLCCLFVCLFVC